MSLPRAKNLVTNLSNSYWVDVAEDYMRRASLLVETGAGLILVAAIASGDVSYSLSSHPHALALGLNYLGGSGRAPVAAWRDVLKNGAVRPATNLPAPPQWVQQNRVVSCW